jgi:hypothetical protein
VRAHVSALRDLAARQHLDAARADEAALAQQLRRDDGAGVEPLASVSRFTTSYSTRNGLWKPRFGTRRCSGIWPPSNPRLNL